ISNLHLAVGRVLHASGAAEVIDMIFRDEDQFNGGNVECDYCWFCQELVPACTRTGLLATDGPWPPNYR
ncbi:hypothetical protein V1522DRAFT_358364, partial [Lipomyces starkeyi]